MTTQEKAAEIRAKHPDSEAYAHLDDKTLVERWLVKYPEQGVDIDDPSMDEMVRNAAVKEVLKHTPMGLAYRGIKKLDPEFELISDDGSPSPHDDKPLANDDTAKYWKEQGDYPEAGAEVPVEQRLAENTVKAGNAVGLGYGAPALAMGLKAGAMKGIGAITKGLAKPLESASETIGSMIPTGWRNLPDEALQAVDVVEDATHYAMNPHPEVQQALADLAMQNHKYVAGAESAVEGAGEGASLVRAGGSEIPAAGAAAEVPAKFADFDTPIFSMSNMQPKTQLLKAKTQMKTVGEGIGAQLESLEGSGKNLDIRDVVDWVQTLKRTNAVGTEIAPRGFGGFGEQAVENEKIAHALQTIKNEALDNEGSLHEIPWSRANAIKGSLQRLAEETGDYYTKIISQRFRDEIDNQAARLLAARGDNIEPFQMLRQAYGKLATIVTTLNSQVLSGLKAKNQIPVVRGGIALAGAASGEPAIPAAMATDWFGRKYGTLALARGLKNLSKAPAEMSRAGAGYMADLKPGIKGILAGLSRQNPEEDLYEAQAK